MAARASPRSGASAERRHSRLSPVESRDQPPPASRASVSPQPEWHHLPRLGPEYYRGFAVVLWTVTLERRATGWLDDRFHQYFRELLLHAASRQALFCPVYVLMPDHLHFVWMGMRVRSDQRLASRFLRKELSAEFARRSTKSGEFALQKQSHDRVLREQDRRRGAYQQACF